MGKLLYGAHAREIDVDDRMLSHLEIAILSKLRRQEPFALTWTGGQSTELGARRTVWISSGIELEFVYATSESQQINRAWVELLASSADRGNMQLRPEPEAVGNSAREFTKVI